jgi:hypothetical protein
MITSGFFQRTVGPGDHGPRSHAARPLMLAAPEMSATGGPPAVAEDDGACLDDWFGMSAACEDQDGPTTLGRC